MIELFRLRWSPMAPGPLGPETRVYRLQVVLRQMKPAARMGFFRRPGRPGRYRGVPISCTLMMTHRQVNRFNLTFLCVRVFCLKLSFVPKCPLCGVIPCRGRQLWQWELRPQKSKSQRVRWTRLPQMDQSRAGDRHYLQVTVNLSELPRSS